MYNMDRFENMLKNIEYYKDQKIFCDVNIKVDGKIFSLHKIMLSASSKYFEKMFTIDMMEKNMAAIVVNDITHWAFSACVDYIYSGILDIKQDSIVELLHAACLLQLWEVKQKCVEYAEASLDLYNCTQFYELSKMYHLSNLTKKIETAVAENAKEILENPSIIRDMNSELMRKLLMSDDLVISDESVAFHGLMKWIEADKEERGKFQCEFIQLIKLPLIGEQYLTKEVCENLHIKYECRQCEEYLQRTMLYINKNSYHQLQPKHTRLRKGMLSEIIIPSDCKFLEVCNFKDNELYERMSTTFDPIPITTRCNAVVSHNNQLYVLGEDNGRRSFHLNCPKEKSWKEISPMNRDHNDLYYRSSVVCYQNKILVVGGRIGDGGIKLVDEYDPHTNTWNEFACLNEARWDAASVTTDKNVFVIGGYNRVSLSSVEIYTDSHWRFMPGLNKARHGHAAAFHDGKIFVAGGWNDELLRSVETFVEGDSSWTFLPNINHPRNYPCMMVRRGRLYVIGGYREEESSLYETWNKETNSWEQSQVADEDVDKCKVVQCRNYSTNPRM